MAKTFNTNASSLYTKYYASTSTYQTQRAQQGRYTGNNSLLVGIIRFGGLSQGNNWRSRVIKSIRLVLKHGESGRHNGSNKTFGFWTSAFQTANDTGVNGSDFLAGQTNLGNIAKPCSSNTDVVFSFPQDGQAMFDALVTYIRGGNDTLLLYIDEPLTGTYTENYMSVLSGSIEIVYEDSVVYYGAGGKWVPCMTYRGNNGAWEPVTAYFGTGGSWKKT